MRKTIGSMRLFPLWLLLSVYAFPACAGQVDPRPALHVAATTPELASLVAAVGGERVFVDTVQAPAELGDAELLVRVGLGYEPWLDGMKLPPRMQVADASRGVRLLHRNPYYWLDPHNGQPITASILAALVALSPDDRETFEANRDAFLVRLSDRIFRWESRLKPLRGATALVLRDEWRYFAERFGLRIVTPAQASAPAAPRPDFIIADPASDAREVERLARKTGAKALTLLTSGEDYVGLFEEDVRRLAARAR